MGLQIHIQICHLHAVVVVIVVVVVVVVIVVVVVLLVVVVVVVIFRLSVTTKTQNINYHTLNKPYTFRYTHGRQNLKSVFSEKLCYNTILFRK